MNVPGRIVDRDDNGHPIHQADISTLEADEKKRQQQLEEKPKPVKRRYPNLIDTKACFNEILIA